ncbi:hypothetical protein AQUCO_05300111v1 [Aquilegia coerulea]|uniref:DUF8003 domain-containing protein n=1 Tax=Aquilegia coerulea TaxID=218851 RepID=A0A2G5CIF4_AQUCA|nr:hypothetical protein AQUCO_05300111v1 [Aquilegia coerulea]
MHPLCWSILLGHITFTLILSLGYCTSKDVRSVTLKDNYYDSSFSNEKERSKPHQILFALSYSSNYTLSCEEDLKGAGSLNTTCVLNSDLYLNHDLYVYGTGNLEVSPHVSVVCLFEDCTLNFNISGNVKLGRYAALVASSVTVSATNLTLDPYSTINTTSLGGPPPAQTSGTPKGLDGAGGGHGGRGASCLKSNETDIWGGDVYSWSTLSDPWSYGSKGASTSAEKKFGGNGGGRVRLKVMDVLDLIGSVTAEGGEGGLEEGGGSGGSIVIQALKLKGNGTISAAGGRGWGGGGGGRISLNCYSIQDVEVTTHGGESLGCPGNAGAAGTIFDATLLSLRVSNDNVTTRTETPLLDFSTSPLWSNVYVENHAKVLVPLLWSRVQVRGQISVLYSGSISFGLSNYPVSEFELVAEELLISDSVIKVYGAFRMAVKMLLMWNSKIQIDGGGNADVATSVLEVRNLIVLRENSVILSNANLGLYGQGHLKLTGFGDAIKGQRLFLSLFYNITVGPGSLLQAPLDDHTSRNLATKSHCESQACPEDLLTPPEDCHVNNTLSFSLQICRVEDLSVTGLIKGSIIHIHRARTVIVDGGGMITASEFGCEKGIGMGNYSNGAGGGAGHGGRGGSGFSNGLLTEGGKNYGDADLPCELGSGSEGLSPSYGNVAGGGMIVMGSSQWPLARLDVYGELSADGESYDKATTNSYSITKGGLGGGSGGTILLFLQTLTLGNSSSVSVTGGNGSAIGGGGGGGGRLHFDWYNIAMGDEYFQIATINGSISVSGGAGSNGGRRGEIGTVTGKKCPKGLYGTFCNECPVGTYKDVDGSQQYLCTSCPLELLPSRAYFIYVRGGVSQPSCPYKCISEKYRMPNCYTPLEELIYTFGGPLPFAFVLSSALVLLSLLLSTLRIKFVGSEYVYRTSNSIDNNNHQSPHLLSLAEVRGTSRAEEIHSHVHRMYFMGPNTFREPWHLPYSPPDAIIDIVYEDAFNRFIDEINSVATYEWWEGSVHSIISVLAYPCAWSWKQWRRRKKILRLQEYVKSEYDHSCLRSCRSRALYKGMKVGAAPDLMVAYIDFFLGGDEKRLDVASIQHRFPMLIVFGGDGSYMSPYNLRCDPLLTNLLDQHVPASTWNRFVAGLNGQLRTVRQGSIRSALLPVLKWISSHANSHLELHGVRIELGWFQVTASGYYQLGILVVVDDYSRYHVHPTDLLGARGNEHLRINLSLACNNIQQLQQNLSYNTHALSHKKLTGGINGGIINDATLKSLDYRRDILFPFSLFLDNTRPIGLQDTLQLLISMMLLGDLAITLLTLLQYYWMSLGAFLAFVLILPLSLLSPFPAGLNALFSQGPKKAPLARVYALWNVTSLSNIVVAFICGVLHYVFSSTSLPEETNAWNLRREDEKWWILPTVLFLVKAIQARFIDWHIANLEIDDRSLFDKDPESFWSQSNSSQG